MDMNFQIEKTPQVPSGREIYTSSGQIAVTVQTLKIKKGF